MRYKTKSAFIATHPLLLIIDFSPHFVVQSRWVTFFDGNDKLEVSILNQVLATFIVSDASKNKLITLDKSENRNCIEFMNRMI